MFTNLLIFLSHATHPLVCQKVQCACAASIWFGREVRLYNRPANHPLMKLANIPDSLQDKEPGYCQILYQPMTMVRFRIVPWALNSARSWP